MLLRIGRVLRRETEPPVVVGGDERVSAIGWVLVADMVVSLVVSTRGGLASSSDAAQPALGVGGTTSIWVGRLNQQVGAA